jgi:hypothetical protein
MMKLLFLILVVLWLPKHRSRKVCELLIGFAFSSNFPFKNTGFEANIKALEPKPERFEQKRQKALFSLFFRSINNILFIFCDP